MPKTEEYMFNPKAHTIRQNSQKQRNRIAQKLQNPRIRQIHLHTFRHWKATTEYYKTKNILYRKKFIRPQATQKH
ncbi:MAG: hypothetical protein QXR42_04035 [Candidatus Bathyarchaeia archaeon]